MKLYATTTSERASKGQGGNEYINGIFTCDEDIVVQVRICSYDDENWRIQITTPDGTSFQTYPKQTKGKNQKGEWKKAQCGHGINKDEPCPDCEQY